MEHHKIQVQQDIGVVFDLDCLDLTPLEHLYDPQDQLLTSRSIHTSMAQVCFGSKRGIGILLDSLVIMQCLIAVVPSVVGECYLVNQYEVPV